MRRPSHDASLPRWAIQLFGICLFIALMVYGMATGSNEILFALVPVGLGCLGLSVFERVDREVRKAIAPDEDGAP